jgi:hypothetical protein
MKFLQLLEALGNDELGPDELGSDNDTDRLARAQAMGFDTSTMWYHGSPTKGLTSMDPNAAKNHNTVGDMEGMYFTTEPHVASGYARTRVPFGQKRTPEQKVRGSVYSVFLRMTNPLDTTNAIKRRKKGVSFSDAKRAALQKVDRSKHDGVIFRGDSMNSPEAIVFDPRNVRSVKAAFNDTGSNNLLASKGNDDEYVTEAPVADFYVDDSVDDSSTWGERDRKMLNNPKLELLARKRIKAAVPIDMQFLGLVGEDWIDDGEATERFFRILDTFSGIPNQNELYNALGVRANPNKDAITVLYLSNTNDIKGAIPITPWMMMHRLGHSIEDAIRGGKLGDRSDDNGRHVFFSLIPNKLLTMKSSRDSNLQGVNGGESIAELFAQYLHDGKIKLARIVDADGDMVTLSNGHTLQKQLIAKTSDNITFTNMWKMSTEEVNEYIDKLELVANNAAEKIINLALGKVFVSP